MRNEAGAHPSNAAECRTGPVPTPKPTMQFRRRAWHEFQRALDPLAPPKPLPPLKQQH
jgi:hypothetical protein